MFCPICKGTTVGKIGNNQYYCRECFLEYKLSKNKIRLFQVDNSGELSLKEELNISYNEIC